MSPTTAPALTTRVMLGFSRVDITPPPGIYHGFWGAAPAHAAAGVHRPLYADVLTFRSCDGTPEPVAMCFVDHVNLEESRCEAYRRAIAAAAEIAVEQVILTFSHTHGSGIMDPDRAELPGGEKIAPYLETLQTTLEKAAAESVRSLEEVTITYAHGQCAMVANRDYWDEEREGYVCGYNPRGVADQTVLVARITRADGRLRGTVVNYGCHPTTLAWQNELVSPDYVGATRALVEEVTGAPCIFMQGACGDQGPRQGFVGDTEIAERNGRSLGFAALSVVESMGPPGEDFHYSGPVVSGATIGTWEHRAQAAQRVASTRRFEGGPASVDLPMLALADAQTLSQEMQVHLAEQSKAAHRGDRVAARDYGARAERARRWLKRLESLPRTDRYAFGYSAYRMGDAVWVSTGGEPYTALQGALRERFPRHAILLCPLSGHHAAGYMLPEDRYGQGLYQEETTVLAPGALETLTRSIGHAVEGLL